MHQSLSAAPVINFCPVMEALIDNIYAQYLCPFHLRHQNVSQDYNESKRLRLGFICVNTICTCLDQKTYQKKFAPKADSPYDALMFNNVYKMWRKAGLYIQGSYDLQ